MGVDYNAMKAEQDEILKRLRNGNSAVVSALDDMGKSVGAKLDAYIDAVANKSNNTPANTYDWLAEFQKIMSGYMSDKNRSYDAAEEARERAKNRVNADYKESENLLNKSTESSKAELEKERIIAEQTANINYNKLLKYLPTHLKAQGLGGVGTSSGTYLKAANDHNNRISDALARYSSGMRSVENTHSTSLAALKASKNTGLDNADAAYEQAIANADNIYGSLTGNANAALLNYIISRENENNNNILTNQEAWYNTFKDRLNTTVFDSKEEIDSLLAEAKGKTSENGYAMLESIANEIKGYMDKDETARIEGEKLTGIVKVTAKKGDGYVNDTIKVTDSAGNTFRITTGEESPAVAAVKSVVELDTNTVFVYEGRLYYKAPNGKVVEVKKEKKHDKLYNYIENIGN